MRRLALWVAFAFTIGTSWAHKPSDSYLRLQLEPSGAVQGQWDIALRDLESAIGLDADGDGQITWGELRARHGDIAAHAIARLRLEADGKACTLAAVGEQLVADHTDGAYTVLPLQAQCPAASQRLVIGYTLLAEIDSQHRGLLNLVVDGQTRSAVLDPQAVPTVFELAAPSGLGQFIGFLKEGVWHIWIGLDHILFLVALLLPAVLVREAGRWRPVAGFGAAFIDVFKVVTAFTIAHSVTLSLAALELVTLPSAFVESVIAVSVVLAALNNVWPVARGRRWMVAFGFGLIHGFGFASVLAGLGLPKGLLAWALAAFNIGVELGQLAIVALFLPLAYALRGTALYRRVLLFGGSLAIAALAGVWFVERAFGLRLLGL